MSKAQGPTDDDHEQATKAIVRDACCELIQGIFWDSECVERMAAGWLECAPKKVTTITNFVTTMVKSIMHGSPRFAMDTWGLYFFQHTHLRVRYEWLTRKQRALAYYIFSKRRHVFSVERIVGDGAFWVGKTYISASVMGPLVHREGVVLALVCKLLAYQDGAYRRHLYHAFSSMCAASESDSMSFIGRVGYALGHSQLTVEELSMIPTRPPPRDIAPVLRPIQKIPKVTQGALQPKKRARSPAGASTADKEPEAEKEKLSNNGLVEVSQWTGVKTRKLPGWNARLIMTEW